MLSSFYLPDALFPTMTTTELAAYSRSLFKEMDMCSEQARLFPDDENSKQTSIHESIQLGKLAQGDVAYNPFITFTHQVRSNPTHIPPSSRK